MALKNVRVTPNYSSSSFRQDGSRKSADNTLKSSLIWEIFHPKLSVDSSESSLDKPLHTCDSPKDCLSSRYLHDSNSHLSVSSKRYIKNLGNSVQVLQPRRSSVIKNKTSDTKISYIVVNSSCQKRSYELDQTKSCVNKVRKQDDLLSSSKLNFPGKDFCLNTLENFRVVTKLMFIYPKKKLGH